MTNAEIQELYERYAFLIYGRCVRILRSEEDARDAMQAVFLKLLQHSGRIRNRESVVPWIYRTAKNHCFNVLRSRKHICEEMEPDWLASPGSLEERLDARMVMRFLLATQDQRVHEAVYYTFVEQLEQKEIQKVTGQSPATIRRNLAKFRRHASSMRERFGI